MASDAANAEGIEFADRFHWFKLKAGTGYPGWKPTLPPVLIPRAGAAQGPNLAMPEDRASSSSTTYDIRFARSENKEQESWAADEGAKKAKQKQEQKKYWSGARRWRP